MHKNDDWRLLNQAEYLKNAKLIKSQYQQPNELWDHDHCAFCWDKFSEKANDLNSGYCTADKKYWICDECFADFKDDFNFELTL